MKLRQSWIAPSIAALALASARADAAPAIRSNDKNRVPVCASPERLTSYLRDRNPRLDPRFADIALWYRHWGEAWRVRWDYAFFQMIVETNALKFRRGDGRMGDVNPSQNNFAGIGATGGGVAGNGFPDVKTGVHAQIQHLVAYSGERLKDPVAPRTALKQDDIIELSRRLKRPVTFGDLSRRWAADRHYARTIDAVANDFKSRYCGPKMAKAETFNVPKPQPASRTKLAPSDTHARRYESQDGAAQDGEILPWQRDSDSPSAVKSPANKIEYSAPKATNPVRQEAAAVRTIWKRGSDANVSASIPQATRQDQLPATVALRESLREDELTEPPAGAPSIETADNSMLSSLPRFKIEPAATGPSHLGGPIPANATASVGDARSLAHLKQTIAVSNADETTSAQPTPSSCRVLTASYGGDKTLLVRAHHNGETVYTALTVLEGFETSMFDSYAKVSPPGAEVIAEYENQDSAISEARSNCYQQQASR